MTRLLKVATPFDDSGGGGVAAAREGAAVERQVTVDELSAV